MAEGAALRAMLAHLEAEASEHEICAAQLSPAHLGRWITVPNLHAPGADWDAPRVSITGRLSEYRWQKGWPATPYLNLALTGHGLVPKDVGSGLPPEHPLIIHALGWKPEP